MHKKAERNHLKRHVLSAFHDTLHLKCIETGIDCAVSQLFFNPQQLVIFCHPFTSAWRTGFNLSGI